MYIAWQHQFLDHVVHSREDYWLHIEYIHNNPIKHGLCDKPEDYRWSSYRYYALGEDVGISIARAAVP
jgi:putative transposase